MRDQIPRTLAIQVLEGNAGALPLPDQSAEAAWLSLVIHHIPDLGAAAHQIRRVLRPGAPVLIRQGFPDRYEPSGNLKPDGIELVRWFPETVRMITMVWLGGVLTMGAIGLAIVVGGVAAGPMLHMVEDEVSGQAES